MAKTTPVYGSMWLVAYKLIGLRYTVWYEITICSDYEWFQGHGWWQTNDEKRYGQSMVSVYILMKKYVPKFYALHEIDYVARTNDAVQEKLP